MATLHDTALATGDASGTTLSTADALAVTAGDLVVVGFKHEGATAAVTSVDTGASTPAFSVARATEIYAGNNDLNGFVYYWTATATGTINPRVVLAAARTFRKLKAYSFTPAGGATWALGNTNSAQVDTTTPSAGAADATAAGVSVAFFQMYASRALTVGAGWSEAAEFNLTDAQDTEYRLPTGAESITGNGTLDNTTPTIAQIATFSEVASGDTPMAQGLC